MKSKVLVVAGGEWQVPIIKFLKDKGHFIFVVDPYIDSPGVSFADKHIKCDVRDFENIKEIVKNERLKFITTDQSDISVNTVAQLNSHFNLPGNSMTVTNNFVNKYTMRSLAGALDLPMPKYSKISNGSELQNFIASVGLPIILKPADSQSSRGVVKIKESNYKNIEKLIHKSMFFSNCGYLIAEEFVEGQEITVEGFASNYKHRTLAISIKKHFRTGIASELRYPVNNHMNIYNEIEKINDNFVERSGLRFGITHAEYIINTKTGRIALIEIACRGGGTLISSNIIKWVSGVDVYEHLYANLNNDITDVKRLKVLKRNAILKFFEFKPGIVKSIYGLDEISNIKEILSCNLSFKVGEAILPADDDRSRQGYFIALANSNEELNLIIQKVAKTIKISYE